MTVTLIVTSSASALWNAEKEADQSSKKKAINIKCVINYIRVHLAYNSELS